MKYKAFLGASLIAGVAASLCCTLPLIAAVAGIGAAGISGFFAPWRPYLLGLTAALLALGFYFSYRKPSPVPCEPGAACEYPAANRYGRLGLWVTTGLVILFAAFPYYSAPVGKLLLRGSRAQAASPSTALQHVSFSVQGMSCPVCAEGVEHKLKSIPGVQRAAVSYDQKKADIEYDPRLVTVEQLQEPFKDAGFKASKN